MSLALPTPERDPLALSTALVNTAMARLGPDHLVNDAERARAAQLAADHAAMMDAAKSDMNLDLTSLTPPLWLITEQKKGRPLEQTPELYIQKETARAQHLAKTLTPLMFDAPEGPLVDIGTRSGLLPHLLAQDPTMQHRHISGLDLPQTLPTDGHPSHDFRSGKHPLVKTYDGDQMPYADNSVAIATLNCVLHHVEPPSGTPEKESPELDHFLSELKRVMKPNGVILITEDFMGGTREDRLEGNPYAATILGIDDVFYPTTLGSQRSRYEWVRILQYAGFEVDFTRCVGSYNVAGFPVPELVIRARKPAQRTFLAPDSLGDIAINGEKLDTLLRNKKRGKSSAQAMLDHYTGRRAKQEPNAAFTKTMLELDKAQPHETAEAMARVLRSLKLIATGLNAEGKPRSVDNSDFEDLQKYIKALNEEMEKDQGSSALATPLYTAINAVLNKKS